MTGNLKYECEVCDERGFNSRADWLFHLTLERHSKTARENMQSLYLQASGNLFVISELQEMDKTSLLQYVAGSVPSFSNFVCFRPEANLCVIACDEIDFTKLSASSQVIDGIQPKFRAYNEIPPAKWKSYFSQNQTEVKKGLDSMKQEDNTNAPTSAASSSRANSNSGKRNGGNDLQQEHGTKLPKLELEDDSSLVLGSGNGEDPSQIKTNLARWTDEMIELNEFIMMPETETNARRTVIEDLKKRFRSIYPTCELINVGGDFLGFNLDKDELRIFCDWQGLTNPQNISNGNIHTVVETDDVIHKVFNRLFNLLTSCEENGPIQSVKFDGNQMKVVYLLNGLIPMNCTLMLRPFKLVQTTLLCKQLFFMNPQSISLGKMVVYWAMKHGFADTGLHNYYPIYWLVYFFLIQTKVIGPVIELQKSCNYQIIDREMNVAFSYEPSLISQVAPRSSNAEAENDIRILLNWFKYMIQTFNNVNKNVSRYSSLVCPRFGELIDKIKFRVVGGGTTSKKVSEQQLRQWAEDLKNVGFDGSTWQRIGRLQLPDTLSIQHPFYIDENISLDFVGPFAKRFFATLRLTKGNLTHCQNLPVDHDAHFSFLGPLSTEKSFKFAQKIKTDASSVKEEPYISTEEDEQKIPKVDSSDSNSDSEDVAGDEVKNEILGINFSLPTLDSSYLANWTNDIHTMFESVTLSADEMTIREAVIEGLKSILRPLFRFCILIPVGADFLGFKTEDQVFNIYLDSRGATDPENPNKKRTINESNSSIRNIQRRVIGGLRESPSVLEVSPIKFKTHGPVSVKFVFAVRGHGQLRCNMLLTPFKSAETALLCKQLFMTNPQTMNLVVMMMYWGRNRKIIAACFLANPFVLLWLIYFFLIKKNILPPVVELQKSCDYEITDHPFSNVAFSYDPKILNPIYQRLIPSVSANNLKSNVELLVECFMFIDKLGNPSDRRSIRRSSVICPRVGELIDKKVFRVCKKSKPKAIMYGEEELRERWTEIMLSVGFDKDSWERLAKLRFRDDFVMQHPFYISDNICSNVKGPKAKAFFRAIKQTKENLTPLSAIVKTQPNVSLIQVLSSKILIPRPV